MSDRFPEPTEAMRFLRDKQIVETESWDDLKHGEHSHAFTVAHSTNAGVVEDIHSLLAEYQADGRTIRDFRRDVRKLMESRGWYGRQDIEPDDDRYINWRTDLMFDTNMRTAHSAGRTRQMLRAAGLRPIWVYKSLLVGDNRRGEHVELHDSAFYYNDSFWVTYDPPNAWGCECYKVSMTEDQARRRGIPVLTDDDVPQAFRDSVPEEWRYSPGFEAFAPDFRRYETLRRMRRPDGRRVIEEIREQYERSVASSAMTAGEWDVWSRRVVSDDHNAQNVLMTTATMPSAVRAAMEDRTGLQIDTKITARDSDLSHAVRDQKPVDRRVTGDDLPLIHQAMTDPSAVYRDRRNDTFHFVADLDAERVIDVILRRFTDFTTLRLRTVSVSRRRDVERLRGVYTR